MLTAIIRIHQFLSAAAILAVATFSSAMAQSDFVSPIVGTWITQQLTEVTIEPCEAGYCGYITKIVVPQEVLDQYGEEEIKALGEENFFDYLNKDPELRERPILGLELLTLTTKTGPERYDGTIYNPQDGETYEGFIEVTGPDTVELTGCVFFNRICRGEEWTRSPFVIASEASEDAEASG